MSVRLLQPETGRCLLESTSSGFFPDAAAGYEELIRPLPEEGEFREYRMRRMRLVYLHTGPGLCGPLRLENRSAGVCMIFPLAGSIRLVSGDLRQGMEAGPGHHNIFYSDGQTGCCEWTAGSNIRLFGVQMEPALFRSLLPAGSPDLDPFLEAMEKGRNTPLRPHALHVSPLMMRIIQEMLETGRTGPFKRIFLESRVLELLLLQLEQMDAHDCGEFCNLRRADVDKIHAARDIILRNLGTPCTLIGLAQQVGTNEFTLKKGFRELFGTTVFGFWSELKMARARQLLTEEGLSVGEVSDLIGYKNAQHFSTAFKRRYGLPPGELKK